MTTEIAIKREDMPTPYSPVPLSGLHVVEVSGKGIYVCEQVLVKEGFVTCVNARKQTQILPTVDAVKYFKLIGSSYRGQYDYMFSYDCQSNMYRMYTDCYSEHETIVFNSQTVSAMSSYSNGTYADATSMDKELSWAFKTKKMALEIANVGQESANKDRRESNGEKISSKENLTNIIRTTKTRERLNEKHPWFTTWRKWGKKIIKEMETYEPTENEFEQAKQLAIDYCKRDDIEYTL
jgi:hypothetical protein